MSKRHEITISPRYRLKDPLTLLKEDKKIIRRYLNRFSKLYILYPEFDNKQRLHYHGMVEVHDKIKLFRTKHLIDKNVGWTKIGAIATYNDQLKWLMYCKKNKGDYIGTFKPIIYKSLRKRVKAIKPNDLDEGILRWYQAKPEMK